MSNSGGNNNDKPSKEPTSPSRGPPRGVQILSPELLSLPSEDDPTHSAQLTATFSTTTNATDAVGGASPCVPLQPSELVTSGNTFTDAALSSGNFTQHPSSSSVHQDPSLRHHASARTSHHNSAAGVSTTSSTTHFFAPTPMRSPAAAIASLVNRSRSAQQSPSISAAASHAGCKAHTNDDDDTIANLLLSTSDNNTTDTTSPTIVAHHHHHHRNNTILHDEVHRIVMQRQAQCRAAAASCDDEISPTKTHRPHGATSTTSATVSNAPTPHHTHAGWATMGTPQQQWTTSTHSALMLNSDNSLFGTDMLSKDEEPPTECDKQSPQPPPLGTFATTTSAFVISSNCESPCSFTSNEPVKESVDQEAVHHFRRDSSRHPRQGTLHMSCGATNAMSAMDAAMADMVLTSAPVTPAASCTHYPNNNNNLANSTSGRSVGGGGGGGGIMCGMFPALDHSNNTANHPMTLLSSSGRSNTNNMTYFRPIGAAAATTAASSTTSITGAASPPSSASATTAKVAMSASSSLMGTASAPLPQPAAAEEDK